MLNHITIAGRIVADPELRTTPDGTPVCTIRIACDRDYKNKQTGERETDFINVVAWKGTAEFISRNFAKGKMIVVDGRLQIRPYTDRDGNKRTAAEVVAESVYFGDSKPSDTAQTSHTEQATDSTWKFNEAEIHGDDSDIPY